MEQYTLTRSDGCTVTGTIDNGKITGAVTVTRPSGAVESIRHYVDNVPTGTHTTFDEQGNTVSELVYKDGQLDTVNGQKWQPMTEPEPVPDVVT